VNKRENAHGEKVTLLNSLRGYLRNISNVLNKSWIGKRACSPEVETWSNITWTLFSPISDVGALKRHSERASLCCSLPTVWKYLETHINRTDLRVDASTDRHCSQMVSRRGSLHLRSRRMKNDASHDRLHSPLHHEHISLEGDFITPLFHSSRYSFPLNVLSSLARLV